MKRRLGRPAPPKVETGEHGVREVERRGRGLLLRYLRRRPMPLWYKLALPSVLGMLLLLVLGGSVGLAFARVSQEANVLVLENERNADATRLQIEVRAVMDAAQSALNDADPNAIARLFQQRLRLRAAISAAAARDPASLPAVDQNRLATVQMVLDPLDRMAAQLQRGYRETAQSLWDREVYDDMANAVTAAADFRRSTVLRAEAAAGGNLDAIRSAALLSAVVLGLALLALPLLVWINHALVVTPIEQVTQAMTRIAGGDLSARVSLDHNDELGRLEDSFNDMTSALALLLESARSGEGDAPGPGSALLQSAQAVAGRVSRTASELEQAYRIQSALLPPQLQTLPGWHVEAARVPATELGGDFYDLLNLPGGRLGLVIGDVSGHGAASALIAAWTQGMIALAAADEHDPGRVLSRVNDLLQARLPPRMFVTLAYAVLDPQRGLLEYANAGQCDSLIRFYPTEDLPGNGHGSAAPGWRWLDLPGFPLGSMPGEQYETARFPLNDVQGFILYSDGIIEARDLTGQFYGFERFQRSCETLVPLAGLAPDAPPPAEGGAAQQILQGALDHAATLRPEDDMTVLVVRRADSLPVRPPLRLDSADNRFVTSLVALPES